MKLVAVNGSPRKEWNTATLLEHACRGAASVGAQTSLHHLYDYSYTGCRSCFACKRLEVTEKGHCYVKDGLSPLLEEIFEADALIVGSPVYFFTETGMFRAFMERLLFPWASYEKDVQSYFTGKKPCAVIYTMNITEQNLTTPPPSLPPWLTPSTLQSTPYFFDRIYGHCETLLATDTLQVDDYAAYAMSRFDATHKQAYHEEHFDALCIEAQQLGKKLCGW